MGNICHVYVACRHRQAFSSKSQSHVPHKLWTRNDVYVTFTTGSISDSRLPEQLCWYRVFFHWTYHLSTAECRDSEVICFICYCDCDKEAFSLSFVSFFKLLTAPETAGEQRFMSLTVFLDLLKHSKQAVSSEVRQVQLCFWRRPTRWYFSSNKTQVSLRDGHLKGCFISLSIHSVSLSISHIHILSMLLEIERLHCITSFFSPPGTSFINGSELARPDKDLIYERKVTKQKQMTPQLAFNKVSFHHSAR